MHPGIDPEDVLVPHRFRYRRVTGDDRPEALDRAQVFVSGLSDLPLYETVPEPAPQGPGDRINGRHFRTGRADFDPARSEGTPGTSRRKWRLASSGWGEAYSR